MALILILHSHKKVRCGSASLSPKIITLMIAQLKPAIFIKPSSPIISGATGFWINAAQSAKEMHQQIEQLMQLFCKNPSYGYCVADYKNFANIEFSQFTSYGEISRVGRFLRLHGVAYQYHVAFWGSCYATIQTFDEAYRGVWDGKEEFFDDYFLRHPKTRYSRLSCLDQVDGGALDGAPFDYLLKGSHIGFQHSPTSYYAFKLD